MSLRVKVYGFLALVAVLAVGGYFLKQRNVFAKVTGQAKSDKASKDDKKAGDGTVVVELAAARRGPISSHLLSTANLRALRDVVVTTQTEGVVQRVVVEEGARAEQGQLLCVLDDSKWQINRTLAEQKLAQAGLQLEKARIRQEKAVVQIANTRAELKRKELAFADGLVSEQEVAALRYRVDELEHDQRVAESEVREFGHRVGELKAEIEQAKLEISRTKITAPFAGYITERRVELGQTVRNLDPLFRLAAFSPLYADVHLSEIEAQRVRPGQKATASLGTAGEDAVAQGRVVRVSPVVDSATGTVKVTVEMTPSGEGFKPGAFVRMDIETDARPEAILVPKRAVLEQEGESFVFIARGDTAHRAKVTVGYGNDREVEVRQGVSEGEKVVVAGQGSLKQGDKIREVKT